MALTEKAWVPAFAGMSGIKGGAALGRGLGPFRFHRRLAPFRLKPQTLGDAGDGLKPVGSRGSDFDATQDHNVKALAWLPLTINQTMFAELLEGPARQII